jgi:hypothetical protein
MGLGSSSQTTQPVTNAELRKLLLSQPELQALVGSDWGLLTVDQVPLVKEIGAIASQASVFRNGSQKIETQLISFAAKDKALAEIEKATLNYIELQLKEAEANKAVIAVTPRKKDSDEYKKFIETFEKDLPADRKDCKATEVVLLRLQATKDNFLKSIKLIFRLAAFPGVVASVELASNPPSPDPKDELLLVVAKAQRDKLANCAKK